MSEPRQPLPRSPDAEKGLLSSILLAPVRLMDELSHLTIEHFTDFAHQQIFQRMRALHTAKKGIDLVTLSQALEDNGELEGVGGAAYMTDLFTFCATASNVAYYFEIVHDKFVRRGIIAMTEKTGRRAYDAAEGTTPEELLEEAEAALVALRSDTSYLTSLKHIGAALGEALDEIEVAHQERGHCVGLATGFNDFDRMTGGIKKGQVMVVGARPSNGKTAWMLHCAMQFSREVPVAIFSLEMTARELASRLLCTDAPLDLVHVRDGFFSKEDAKCLGESFHKIIGRPILVDETAQMTVLEFRARARRAVTKFGAQVIFVDYLQLIKSPSKRSQESRQVEVSDVSMALKVTAKELNVPIIACAQLNRDADRLKPRASDLKESGQIEQDADIIVLLHRPNRGTTNDDGQEEMLFIVDKIRNGPTGTLDLAFRPKYTRFENQTSKLFSNKPEERQQKKKSKKDDDHKEVFE